MFKIVLFIFFFIFCVCNYMSWRTQIDMKNPGYESFVATLKIGKDPKEYKLHVDFNSHKIYVDESIRKSITYDEELGGSDFVFLAGESRRLPIREYTEKPKVLSDSRCIDCQGVLGLSKSSFLWNVFPEMTFSRDIIWLGGEMGFEFGKKIEEGRVNMMYCSQFEGLCSNYGDIEINKDKKIYKYPNRKIVIDPTTQDVILPADIYDTYTNGWNIYNDEMIDLHDLKIRIPFIVESKSLRRIENAKDYIKTKKGIDLDDLPTEFNITIETRELIHKTESGGRVLLAKRAKDNSPIILGTQLLRKYIFYYNSVNQIMLAQTFNTNDHYDTLNIFVYAFLFVLLVKWRVNNYHMNTEEVIKSRTGFYNYFLEFLATAISVSTYFYPSTFELMDTHEDLFIGTGVLIFFALFIKILVVLNQIFPKSFIRMISPSTNYYERNYYRSFTHEIIIITGLWIIVLQRRLENESNIWVLLTNIFLLYVISQYVTYGLHYIIYIISERRKAIKYRQKKIRKAPWRFSFFFLFVILVFAYQSIVSVNFFLRPLFITDFQTYQQLLVPALVVLYLFVVAAAVFMVMLDFLKIEKIIENERKKI